MPANWAVMYLCVWGNNFDFFYNLLLDFGTVPKMWYFLLFILLEQAKTWHILLVKKQSSEILDKLEFLWQLEDDNKCDHR